jgi:hypothetical protein
VIALCYTKVYSCYMLARTCQYVHSCWWLIILQSFICLYSGVECFDSLFVKNNTVGAGNLHIPNLIIACHYKSFPICLATSPACLATSQLHTKLQASRETCC